MKSRHAVPIAAVSLAAVALIYTGASAWLGGQIQTRYETSLQQALTLVDPSRSAMHTFRRGIYSSEATLSVAIPMDARALSGVPELPDPGAAPTPIAEPLRVTLVTHIDHGPLVGWRPAAARVQTRVATVEGGDPALRALFAGVAPPVVRAIVTFTGAWDGQLDWPAGRAGDAALSAQWDALVYRFEGSADGKRIEGVVDWPALAVDATPAPAIEDPDSADGTVVNPEAPLHLVLAGLRASFRSERATPGQPWLLASGDASGTLDSIKATRGDSALPLLDLQGLKLHSKTEVNASQQIDAVQTIAGSGKVAGTAIDAFRYEVAFERLNGAALLALQNAVTSRAIRPQQEGTAQVPADPGTAAIGQALGQLIEKNPAYRMQIDATLGGQAGQLKSRIAVAPAGTTTASPDALSPEIVLLSAIQRLEGDASMRVPRQWLPIFSARDPDPAASTAALEQTLGALAGQGLVTADADAYRADMRFSQGRMWINGRPLPGWPGSELDETPTGPKARGKKSGASRR